MKYLLLVYVHPFVIIWDTGIAYFISFNVYSDIKIQSTET